MKREKLLARLIALHGVRNSELENLHIGITPGSKTGDYSDVKVVSPFGDIPWNEVSRISDAEMRKLMLDIEKKIYQVLVRIPQLENEAGSQKAFEKILKTVLYENSGASWDRNKKFMERLYGKEYKDKL